MQYLERTAFIVLFATLHCLVADSKPLPVTNRRVPQAMTTSQPNSAAMTEHSQLHNFNNSVNNYAAGDNYNMDATGPKMSKVDKSHLDNPDYFEGDLKVSQEIIDLYYGVHNDTKVSGCRYRYSFTMSCICGHACSSQSNACMTFLQTRTMTCCLLSLSLSLLASGREKNHS